MKAMITKKVEVEIKSILIVVNPRYIGDTDDDDMRSDTPLLDGKTWKLMVNVDSGEIHEWPKNRPCSIHVKVCDAGVYTLYDDSGKIVAKPEDAYVPNGIVPGSYGDYIEVDIDGLGIITNWPKNPCVDEFFEQDERQ